MKVEFIPSPDRKSQLLILIDGDLWRMIHISIFGFKPSLPKVSDSVEAFSEQFAIIEYGRAKHFAIRRLAEMSLPSSKLVRSLQQRLVSESTISRLIGELEDLGYLNDKEWVASFVRVQSAKCVGPRAIAQKLAGKGLTKAVIEPLLNESQATENQKKSIRKLLTTRYSSRNLTDFRERKKVIASLARRGFDLGLIFDLVSSDDSFEEAY